jgi:hypothetical protein
MTLYIIYKKTFSTDGHLSKVDIVDYETNETRAHSDNKLYNLQIPVDLKDRIEYAYYIARVQ